MKVLLILILGILPMGILPIWRSHPGKVTWPSDRFEMQKERLPSGLHGKKVSEPYTGKRKFYTLKNSELGVYLVSQATGRLTFNDSEAYPLADYYTGKGEFTASDYRVSPIPIYIEGFYSNTIVNPWFYFDYLNVKAGAVFGRYEYSNIRTGNLELLLHGHLLVDKRKHPDLVKNKDTYSNLVEVYMPETNLRYLGIYGFTRVVAKELVVERYPVSHHIDFIVVTVLTNLPFKQETREFTVPGKDGVYRHPETGEPTKESDYPNRGLLAYTYPVYKNTYTVVQGMGTFSEALVHMNVRIENGDKEGFYQNKREHVDTEVYKRILEIANQGPGAKDYCYRTVEIDKKSYPFWYHPHAFLKEKFHCKNDSGETFYAMDRNRYYDSDYFYATYGYMGFLYTRDVNYLKHHSYRMGLHRKDQKRTTSKFYSEGYGKESNETWVYKERVKHYKDLLERYHDMPEGYLKRHGLKSTKDDLERVKDIHTRFVFEAEKQMKELYNPDTGKYEPIKSFGFQDMFERDIRKLFSRGIETKKQYHLKNIDYGVR